MRGEILAFMAAFLWGIAPLLDKINDRIAIGAILSLLLLSLLMRELSFEGIRGIKYY